MEVPIDPKGVMLGFVLARRIELDGKAVHVEPAHPLVQAAHARSPYDRLGRPVVMSLPARFVAQDHCSRKNSAHGVDLSNIMQQSTQEDDELPGERIRLSIHRMAAVCHIERGRRHERLLTDIEGMGKEPAGLPVMIVARPGQR